MTKLEIASAWAQVLATLIVVVSAILAYFAYVHETNKSTEEFSLQVASRLQSGELQDAQVRLFLKVRSVQQSVYPARLGNQDLKVYFEKSDILEDEIFVNDLLALIAYFNTAEQCVQAQICERELLSRLVWQSATGMDCVFSDVLERLSKEANVLNLTSGLKFFSRGECY